MLLRAFALTVALLAAAPTSDVAAHDANSSDATLSIVVGAAQPETTPTGDTINPFYPEERSLGDCLSSLPKPGCGSSARGGWRQTVVLGVILSGLAFIGWRIVRQSRKARAHQ